MTDYIVFTECAGFMGSHSADRPPAAGHTEVGLYSFAQSRVCALCPLAAAADIRMLPKRISA